MKTTRTFLTQMVLCALAGGIALFVACTELRDSGFSSSAPADSGRGGSMARFAVNGNYLYTVSDFKLQTFDITRPDKPVSLPQKDQFMNFGVETIFTMDTLLFIGSQTGMYIYNVARDGFPQQIAYASHITSCDPVVAAGNYAYVTLNSEHVWCGRTSNELHVYDISDPYNPALVHTERGFIHPRGLGVDGHKLFVCDEGLRIFDISDPTKPLWTDDLTHIPEAARIDAYDVIPLDGLLLLIGADGFYQFDYTGEKLAFVSKIEVLSEK